MNESTANRPHALTLDNRRILSLSGVLDVQGFDEETVNVVTTLGVLIIKGTSLHISKLSLETSEVVIDGEISSMHYLAGSEKKGLMARIFK
ncbi:MAG: sporulation protein YabP [Clostridia bacterium]|nr:sporulation protein YabP [Clostridia bacterium]